MYSVKRNGLSWDFLENRRTTVLVLDLLSLGQIFPELLQIFQNAKSDFSRIGHFYSVFGQFLIEIVVKNVFTLVQYRLPIFGLYTFFSILVFIWTILDNSRHILSSILGFFVEQFHNVQFRKIVFIHCPSVFCVG